ncbi:MAG: acyl-CoA dehydrogenase family protein [Acidimicrobiia bacterium]|nr:acyl-CoA dehydrogenase family protein [Acidimicrobiia bacterium]
MSDDRFDPAVLRRELGARLTARTAASRTTIMGAGSDDLETGRAYLRSMAEGGWATPLWPAEYGGMAATKDQAATVADALAGFEVPDLYPFSIGISIVGHTLIDYATPEQCRRWLPPMQRGDEIWCQLFSEPNAGSDLANLGARAVRDGDEWVVNGNKVWSSRSMYSRWGWLLARTDPNVPKHRGITAFVVDMEAPGMDVRPLRQINEDAHFAEVFMTDVRIPDADRVGEVGDGWRIAITTLGYERGGAATRPMSKVPALVDMARATGAIDDATIRQRLVALRTQSDIIAWTNARAAAKAEAGVPGPEGSGGKLRYSPLLKETGRLAKDIQGATGMLTEEGDDGWHTIFLTGPSMSIRGGTDEIQRNIVGERVLALPKEPDLSRDVAFKDIGR